MQLKYPLKTQTKIKTQSSNPECRSIFYNNAESQRWTSKATACSGIPMAETPQNKMHTMEKKTQIKLKCMPDINKFARMKRTARPTFCRKVNHAKSKMNRRRCSRNK